MVSQRLRTEPHARKQRDYGDRSGEVGETICELTAPFRVLGIVVAADPDAELGRRDELVPFVDLFELAAVGFR